MSTKYWVYNIDQKLNLNTKQGYIKSNSILNYSFEW